MLGRQTTTRPAAGSAATGLRFRLALPLGQLLLCAILLWPARAWVFHELGLPDSIARTPIIIRYGGGAGQQVFRWSASTGMDLAAFLNLPGCISELPYAIFSASHRPWKPSHMDFKVWRAVTWPLLGTLFWWVAGRGADALAAWKKRTIHPKVSWLETVIGFLLGAVGITFAIGFVFFAGPDRHDRDLQLAASAAALWAFLASLSVAGKILQWRLRRRLLKAQAIA